VASKLKHSNDRLPVIELDLKNMLGDGKSINLAQDSNSGTFLSVESLGFTKYRKLFTAACESYELFSTESVNQ
jgi:hypothetical protein